MLKAISAICTKTEKEKYIAVGFKFPILMRRKLSLRSIPFVGGVGWCCPTTVHRLSKRFSRQAARMLVVGPIAPGQGGHDVAYGFGRVDWFCIGHRDFPFDNGSVLAGSSLRNGIANFVGGGFRWNWFGCLGGLQASEEIRRLIVSNQLWKKPPRGGFFTSEASKPQKSRRFQQLPQHERQNPPVLVVIDLDRRVDPQDDRHPLRR